MRHLTQLALTLAAVVLTGAPIAHGLTKEQAACQSAIAKAGRAFVSRQLVIEGKCKQRPHGASSATRRARRRRTRPGWDATSAAAAPPISAR
jgi:hypothetical protein